MASLVGQSEERTRTALKVIDAMAPCIVMLDEVEKAFSGVGSSGDSGVAARMFGTFLSWLNDHDSDVFVVCTSNDISKLPPEFSRSERFDGIFFLDLPSREEKDAIWHLYRQIYEIDPTQRKPDDTNWTGAEIKSCCRLAALLDVSLVQAAQNVVPVAVTSSESIAKLRAWATGRCLSASEPGIYSHSAFGALNRSGFVTVLRCGSTFQRKWQQCRLALINWWWIVPDAIFSEGLDRRRPIGSLHGKRIPTLLPLADDTLGQRLSLRDALIAYGRTRLLRPT